MSRPQSSRKPAADTGLDLALEMVRSRRWLFVQEMARRGILTDPQAHETDCESRALLGAFNALDSLADDLAAAIRPSDAILH